MTAKRRGTTAGPPRRYSIWEWTKGYVAWVAVLPIFTVLALTAWLCPTLPAVITRKLLRAHQRWTESHIVDVRIPADPGVTAYTRRWWRIRRNAFFNIYFHIVQRSDEDRALHDHPWMNFSIVLEGGYWEHLILPGGVHQKTWYGPGSVRFRRSGAFAHRLELATDINGYDEEHELPVRTIFITGPALRRWGFHHPKRWVDAYEWDQFLESEGIVNRLPMDGYSEQLAEKGQ